MKYSKKEIILITALFMSKFNDKAAKDLGYKNQTQALYKIPLVYKMDSIYSLKLTRDEFDRLTGSRVGWKRTPRKSIVKIYSQFDKYSYNEYLELIKKFINNFSEMVEYSKNDREYRLTYNALIDDLNYISKSYKKITTRKQMIEARVGQGDYRKHLLKRFNEKCFMTNITSNELLIASHIMPWCKCTNEQKLDLDNGLILSSDMDKLFDNGLITFTDDGKIIVSVYLNKNDQKILNIWDGKQFNISFNDKQKRYLKYHRENEFLVPKDIKKYKNLV